MDIFAPIQYFADSVTGRWLGLESESYLAHSVNFFIYDTIKIGILLLVINYIMAIVRSYLPVEKVRDLLNKRRWYGFEYVLAALLGVITPFCSCSSIPLFIGFLSAGIPLGVTFAFLITSPLVNESSLYVFPAIFGLETTILYNLVGIGVGVAGGILIQKLNMERFIQPEFLRFTSKGQVLPKQTPEKIPFTTQLKEWHMEAFGTTKKIFPYVLLGVGLGASIHGYVPENFVAQYLSVKSWWSVPLATLLGVPLYANSVSVIPVIEALVDKGIPLGSALAFMTATVTLSLPEALLLKKLMKWPLLATFFGITTLGIMCIGFLFNVLL